MKKPKVCVIRTAGTNCDKETFFAFKYCQADVELVHINRFVAKKNSFSDYQIIAIPGGFSYGDDIAAGKILANELKYKFSRDFRQFIAQGKLIIGICNGFQALVKAGILPGSDDFKQEATLMMNDSGKFEDRWVYLRGHRSTGSINHKCIWIRSLPEVVHLPVAHGEGKFIPGDKSVLERIRKNGQVVFRYCDRQGRSGGYPVNPNGSLDDIAGICDKTGRILGLMPHPERHCFVTQHPGWTSSKKKSKEAQGLLIFRNGVEHARKYL